MTTPPRSTIWPGRETRRPESIAIRPRLEALLAEQRKTKRLTPIVNQGQLREQGEGANINSEMVPPLRLSNTQPGA